MSNLPFKVSGCVLPGMDFRQGQSKTCQDFYYFTVHNNCLLAVLCDGHGTEGHHISKYVVDYISKSFKKHFSKLKHDPKSTFSAILSKCDNKILRNLECDLSGTTVVLLLIADGQVHAASLGDSRAVLGSLHPEADQPRARNNKYFRKILCDQNFKVFPLTIDQKPEDEDEEDRIRMSGGLVQKFTDAFGRNVGPFRVWKKDGSGPGLAMSRSLGDKIAKGCGVIAQPIFLQRKIVPAKDFYIVIASDGVWDMMDNVEVINFVQRFKGNCVGASEEYPANPSNSSISRLLCEEARFRWLGMAQQERVAIDDISCVVIDFAVNQNLESVLETETEKKLVTIERVEGPTEDEDG
jgi:serine/threonine protein phosphatase PrpC